MQDMEQQLRDLGVNIELAKNGVTISQENIAVLQQFLTNNANLAQLLEKIAVDSSQDMLLNLLWLPNEQLSAVLNAILQNPEGFATIMTHLTSSEDELKRAVDEVSTYS